MIAVVASDLVFIQILQIYPLQSNSKRLSPKMKIF